MERRLPRLARLLRLVPALVFVDGTPGQAAGQVGDQAPAWQPAARATLAIVGVALFPSPEAPPIEDAVILMQGGMLTAAGPRAETPVPDDAEVVECAGCSALAGFWNVHVHFTEEGWAGADTTAPERLAALLREMLTSHGFVHVLDTGS